MGFFNESSFWGKTEWTVGAKWGIILAIVFGTIVILAT